MIQIGAKSILLYIGMIDNEKVNEIISHCDKHGHKVDIRDIYFVVLNKIFDDASDVYACIFGDDDDFQSYNSSKKIPFLSKVVHGLLDIPVKNSRKNKSEDISFDENLAYMLKIKRDTEEALRLGEIDKKDGLKILADITVKLNDKFNITEEVKEQMVIVNTKFNAVCECGKEIYIPTKDDLIKQYDLVEKNKQ